MCPVSRPHMHFPFLSAFASLGSSMKKLSSVIQPFRFDVKHADLDLGFMHFGKYLLKAPWFPTVRGFLLHYE